MKKTTKFLIWKFRKILMHLLSQICQNKWWALELLSVAQHISAELQANREESFIRAHIPIDQAVHTSKIGIQGRKITKATPKKVKKKREALFKKNAKNGRYSSTNRHGPSDPFQKGWTNQKVAITPSTLALQMCVSVNY